MQCSWSGRRQRAARRSQSSVKLPRPKQNKSENWHLSAVAPGDGVNLLHLLHVQVPELVDDAQGLGFAASGPVDGHLASIGAKGPSRCGAHAQFRARHRWARSTANVEFVKRGKAQLKAPGSCHYFDVSRPP